VSNGKSQGTNRSVSRGRQITIINIIQPMKQIKNNNSVSYVSSKKSKTVYQIISCNLFNTVHDSHASRPCPLISKAGDTTTLINQSSKQSTVTIWITIQTHLMDRLLAYF